MSETGIADRVIVLCMFREREGEALFDKVQLTFTNNNAIQLHCGICRPKSPLFQARVTPISKRSGQIFFMLFDGTIACADM